MNIMRYFSLFFLSVIVSHANAATFYRHIPFSAFIGANDTLIVDYDFSGKKGVYCSTIENKFSVNFIYKGHRKLAFLPVSLQSDHIPDNTKEELADFSGQFTITMSSKKITSKRYEVTCSYGDGPR